MKLSRLPVSAFLLAAGMLVVAVLSCPRAFAADLPAIVTKELDSLEKQRQEQLAEARKPLTDLADNYVAALERVKRQAQKAGELKKLLGADEEIKRVKTGFGQDEELKDPELARLRKTYTEHLAMLEVEVVGKVLQVERGHADSLAAIVRELTQAGMLAEAKHALGLEQVARESLKQLEARSIALAASLQLSGQGAPEGFVLIPAGEFQMGDPLDGDRYAEVRTVNVSAFYMAKHEVTKTLWDRVREWGLKNGYTDLSEGGVKGLGHPVHSINWYDAVKWCNARSEKDGLKPCYRVENQVYKAGQHNNVACDWSANGYRLPTEEEWEKAARGGLNGKRFPWGDTISHKEANFTNNGKEAYQEGTKGLHPKWGGSSPVTSRVGSFPPNEVGLYDMAGNVWEWCWDGFTRYHGEKANRILRGGCWNSYARDCRTANRHSYSPDGSSSSIGFRLARSSAP